MVNPALGNADDDTYDADDDDDNDAELITGIMTWNALYF